MKNSYQLVIVSVIILLSSINLLTQSNEKKVIFQLFDDGTWSKVEETGNSQKIKSISEAWIDFQKAVKKGNKAEIMSFFKYPFDLSVNLDEFNTSGERNCFRPICNIKGAMSKSKLETNFNIVFDNDFVKGVLNHKKDEYTEQNSKRNNRTSYEFNFLVDSQFLESNFNGVTSYQKESGHISYTLYFMEVNSEWKIYNFDIHRKK